MSTKSLPSTAVEQDPPVVASQGIEKSQSLNASIDSGICDVVIKQEPIDDDKVNTTISSNLEINTNECVEVKKEPIEDTSDADNEENEGSINKAAEMQENGDAKIKSTVEMSKEKEKVKDKENTASFHGGSDKVVNQNDVIVNEPNEDSGKASGNTSKNVEEPSGVKVSVNINETCVQETSDSDVVIVEWSDNLMKYRTTEKVISIDDTSDSSPDSSDSDNDSNHGEEKSAENTESQINKIMSNEREASPERERRIKLNRHGFEDLRTKGEILPEELPPLEELTITVDESVVMTEVGSIKSIVGVLVVIQSNENVPPLDDETILFVDGHKVLGQVFEVFGPVRSPWYSVRFNEADNIEMKGLKVGMPVYCAPKEKSFTKFVFVDSLKNIKGSDASWEDNNEPPEKHLDYSDDEAERRAKAKRRNKKFGDNETEEVEEGEGSVQKKNARNRNRNKHPRDGQQQEQQTRRGWNPFQGNSNENNGNCPPRFGPRSHTNGRNSQPPGQRWPRANYNRPQSQFGGPPDFQNRPRMGQFQGQQPFGGRNAPSPSNWRASANTNYQNKQQNFEFVAQPLMNGPHQVGAHVNFQSSAPGSSPSSFRSNQGQLGQNHVPGPMNVDTSQPPPQFQFGNQIRPAAMPSVTNRQHVQLPPGSGNQSVLLGNQPGNNQFMNQGNQIFNQAQAKNFTANPGSNPDSVSSRNRPECNVPQVNFLPSNTNFHQSPLNQSPQNSGFVPQVHLNSHFGLQGQTGGQQQNGRNYGPNITNSSQQNLTNVPTHSGVSCGNNVGFISGPSPPSTFCNTFGSGTVNSVPYNIQLSGHNSQNVSGPNGQGNIQNKQVIGNENIVQGQNYINSSHQGFSPNHLPTGGPVTQFAPVQGFQGNFGPNQTAGQSGFNTVAGGNPYGGSSNHVAGQHFGYNQMGPSGQQCAVVDQRFIQNNSG